MIQLIDLYTTDKTPKKFKVLTIANNKCSAFWCPFKS